MGSDTVEVLSTRANPDLLLSTIADAPSPGTMPMSLFQRSMAGGLTLSAVVTSAATSSVAARDRAAMSSAVIQPLEAFLTSKASAEWSPSTSRWM